MLTLTLIHLTETNITNYFVDFYWEKCKGQIRGGLDTHSSIQVSK